MLLQYLQEIEQCKFLFFRSSVAGPLEKFVMDPNGLDELR